MKEVEERIIELEKALKISQGRLQQAKLIAEQEVRVIMRTEGAISELTRLKKVMEDKAKEPEAKDNKEKKT